MPSIDVLGGPGGGLRTVGGARDGQSMLTQQYGGGYSEAVLRGRVFGCCNQTGVTSQAGLSGTTPVLTLYNPAGSGINVHVWYVGAIFNVAFATASAVFVGLHQTSAAAKAVSAVGTISTNTRNMLSTASLAAGQAQACLAATAATPIGVAILGGGLTGAITTVPVAPPCCRWFDGSLILPEDSAISVQTGVASGAAGLWCEYIWEERPKTGAY